MNQLLKKGLVTIIYTCFFTIYMSFAYIYILSDFFHKDQIFRFLMYFIIGLISFLAYMSYLITIYSSPGYAEKDS